MRKPSACAVLPGAMPAQRLKTIILDSAVGRGRVGCDAVGRQGAPTKWATAHEEKQRSLRTVARRNRLRSVLTQMVIGCGGRELNRHGVSEAVGSGQLPNLGSIAAALRKVLKRFHYPLEIMHQLGVKPCPRSAVLQTGILSNSGHAAVPHQLTAIATDPAKASPCGLGCHSDQATPPAAVLWDFSPSASGKRFTWSC